MICHVRSLLCIYYKQMMFHCDVLLIRGMYV